MSIILHTCCAPCSIMCTKSLRNEGIEPIMFWYNPNIHPFSEYNSRLEGLGTLARTENLEVVSEGASYGLRFFLDALDGDFVNRCDKCYKMRLDAAAGYARDRGFDGFSTTLLISPYQRHERLRELGKLASEAYGVPFIYRDFRPLFREGQRIARDLGLYRQKYCGCIFSEEERYGAN